MAKAPPTVIGKTVINTGCLEIFSGRNTKKIAQEWKARASIRKDLDPSELCKKLRAESGE